MSAPSLELRPVAGNPAPSHRTPSEPEVGEPNAVPSGSRAARTDNNPKHFFGLEQSAPRHEPIFMDDYEKRLPEDAYCEEMTPNARFYRVYVEEAAAFDATMVSQYRDGLDVMLVFAGLFSAVVTSFLVQVSQNLQADYAQMSALLLHDLVSIQLSDGVSTLNITTPSVDPAQKFVPDALDVWINGLWVVSLVAALVVALAAVLVKQWLHHYVSLPSGTPMDRSHVRQFRFMGLECWRVRVIIGMLPLTMHVSLMLFFAGLVLFFIPLRISLAWTIGIITVVVCIVYLIANAMPVLFPQCPYQTPLTEFFHFAPQIFIFAFNDLPKRVVPLVPRWLGVHFQSWIHSREAKAEFPTNLKSMKTLETEVVNKAHPTLSVDALDWLFSMSLNPSVHSIVIQAIGGLSVQSEQYARMVWHEAPGLQMARQRLIHDSTCCIWTGARECLPGSEHRLERLCRSYIFIPVRPSTEIWVTRTGCGPRLAGALLLSEHAQQMCGETRELEDFCLSHQATAMHPLVWRNLVASAANDGANWHSHLLCILLPDAFDNLPSRNESPVPLKAVVNTYLRPVIWDYFLEVLPHPAVHNEAPITLSSEQEALLALGNYAVLGIDAELSTPDAQQDWLHLDLLEEVFRRLVPHIIRTETVETWEATLFMSTMGKHCAFRNLLGTTIDRVTVHRVSMPDELRHRLNRLFSLLYFICTSISSTEPPFLPSFHQLLGHVVFERLFSITNFYTYSVEVDVLGFGDKALTVGKPDVHVMSTALSRGFESAYHLFANVEWIKLLGCGWVVQNIPFPSEIYTPISCYISGISLLPDDVRQEYVAHLYEHPNLTLAFIALSPDVAEATRLVELDPTHSSWQQCRATLEGLRSWIQNPVRESADFPLDIVFGDPFQDFWEPIRRLACKPPDNLARDAINAELRKCFNNQRTEVWIATILGVLDRVLMDIPAHWAPYADETDTT